MIKIVFRKNKGVQVVYSCDECGSVIERKDWHDEMVLEDGGSHLTCSACADPDGILDDGARVLAQQSIVHEALDHYEHVQRGIVDSPFSNEAERSAATMRLTRIRSMQRKVLLMRTPTPEEVRLQAS